MDKSETDSGNSAPAKPVRNLTYGMVKLTLQNCLLPPEKLNPTPSQLDGLDELVEMDLRILGCELIQTAGILLRLPQVAMATGQVLFQRFYYSKSFVRLPMETTAMGCVCLASKIEEAPRRIRDVISVFHHIKQVKNQKPIQPLCLDQNYIALKNQVIKAERRVLKELGFCVHVKHPHKLIVMYLEVLGCVRNTNLVQMCWNYMNDSLRTDVFVRYHPETIACACIYLSARQMKVALPNKPSWFEIFHIKEDDIQDICIRILKLYNRPKPIAEELQKAVDELQKAMMDKRMKERGQNDTTVPPGSGFSPSSRQPSPEKNSTTPENNKKDKPSPPVSPRNNHHGRSASRSRSRSPSPSEKSRKSHKKSRSHERRKKTHRGRRSYSRSRSPSLSPVRNSKKSHSRDKKRYRSRSRSHDRRDRSRSRSHDRYDKYYKSKSKHHDDDHVHKSRSKDRR